MRQRPLARRGAVDQRDNHRTDKSTITLRQTTYIKKVLSRLKMLDGRPVSISMVPGIGNTLEPSKDQADAETITWYQPVVGSLMWPAIHTRPDISYAVGVLRRYCSNPSPLHCKYLQHTMRYLVGTLDLGLVFRKNSDNDLIGYSDSDYAGTKDGRRSTGVYAFMLTGAPILIILNSNQPSQCLPVKPSTWL